MSRWPRPDAARHLLAAVTALIVSGDASAASIAPAALTPVWLDVHPASWAPAETTLLANDDGGGLWAAAEDLADWGVIEPAGAARVLDHITYYSLAAQSGIDSRLDPAQQALWLDVDSQLRTIQLRSLRSVQAPVAVESRAPRESGGRVDADSQWTRSGDQSDFSGLLDGQWFDGRGVSTGQALFDGRRVIRLDTAWRVDDAESMRALVLGDGIASSGAWGRALRFGGVSWGTDFSLRPDQVTFALPQMQGVAALPSTLDLYVNGVLARREPVDAGPFVLSDIPAQTGQGQARLVVRDLLGREQVITQDFYAAPQLLHAGLVDWRIDAGLLREDYALESARYGTPAVVGSHRRGVTDRLTLELRTELERARQVLGAAAAVALPLGGVGELAMAAGESGDGGAGLIQASFEFRGAPAARGLSLGGGLRRVSSRWTDLGERHARDRQSANIRVGLVPMRGWSLALTAVRTDRRDEPRLDLLSMDVGTRLSDRWLVSANLGQTRQGWRDEFLGLTLIAHWGGSSTVVDWRRANGSAQRAFEWQRNARDSLDDRYRIRAEDGEVERLLAEAEWASTRGSVGAALGHDGSNEALRLRATSGLAWLGDDVFWTRAGDDGFAVVDTHGLADVGVLHDHRLAARTDERGLALLPGLRPFQSNTIGLVDADIPIDAEVEALEQHLAPDSRGGVRVDFPVRSAGYAPGLTRSGITRSAAPATAPGSPTISAVVR